MQQLYLTLKEWQTLIAGFIAIVAAAGTIWQIRSVDKNKYIRRANSHKAVLSNVLSMIYTALKDDYRKLDEYLELLKSDDKKKIPAFSWSQEINIGIETIRLVIENDKNPSKNISKEVDTLEFMLAKMQIYHSRRNWIQGKVDISKNEGTLRNIKDCIELYATTISLFNYARPKSLQSDFEISNFDFNNITKNMFLEAHFSIAELIKTTKMTAPNYIREISDSYKD